MTKNLIFVDGSIAGYEKLISAGLTDSTWVILDARTDGMAQIKAAAAAYADLESIQIFSHGAPGTLYLGSTVLTADNIDAYGADLQTIGSALAPAGDILIYGCNVAQGEAGRQFIQDIARLSGADVAASENITGLAGDWLLETTMGTVETPTLAYVDSGISLGTGLDPAFSGDGKVTTDFGGLDYGRSLAVQSDGKILLAGFTGSSLFNQNFAVARYTTGGSLDSSFSGDGKLITNFGWSTHGEALALQSDGKIVVAGGSMNSGEFDFALARYTAAGVLDTAFSGDGLLTTDLGGDDTAYAVTIQSDGKILVAGERVPGVGLVRYNSNGSLDTTFSGDGKVTVTDATGGAYIANAMAVQGDGKILVAGYRNHVVLDPQQPLTPPKTLFDFAVMRFNANGSLDSSFGSGGITVTDLGSDFDEAYGIALQGDGKILVSGGIGVLSAGVAGSYESTGFGLVRYNSNGSLDTSFSGDGIVSSQLGTGAAGFAVAALPDGKVIMSGSTAAGATLLRYNANGTLDGTLDGDGRFDIGFGNMGATFYDVQVLAGGALLAGGTTWLSSSNADFAVARLAPAAATGLKVTGTSGPDSLSGGNYADTLTGLAGNDTLDGGAGSDTLAGGPDNDTYVVDSLTDVVSELVGQGTDLIRTGISYSLVDTDGAGGNGGHIENLTLTGSANINGTGNGWANLLTGNSGANILNGGNGADTLSGGAGNDTYVLDRPDDRIIELAGGGIDTAQAACTYTLAAQVENLAVIGSANYNGTGNDLNNTMSGNAANNVLDGGLGADTLRGGAGNDTYVVDNPGDVVGEQANAGTDSVRSSLSHVLAANVEDLVLTGFANTNGTGNALANVLTGNSGNNILDGGAGMDTASFANSARAVVADLATGTVSGWGADTLIAIENVTGSAYADTLSGSSGANSFKGGAGLDTLDGGGGLDTADFSDKTLPLAITLNTSSLVTVRIGTGSEDRLRNIENLIGGSGADTLIGDGASNTFMGGNGKDVLDGGNGIDTADYSDKASAIVATLNGAYSAMVTIAGVAEDSIRNFENIIGGANRDNLTGDGGANFLTGNGSGDTLSGGGGADVLVGGAGSDSLAGGQGADRFVFDAALGTSNLDVITDFLAATDKLILDDDIFTRLGKTGTATGAALASGTLHAAPGAKTAVDTGDRLIYDTGSGRLYYDADGTGSIAPVQIALLGSGTTHPALAEGDFLIIA